MIYIIEDDQSIQKLISYTLKNQGYDIKSFTLPSELEEAMALELPKLIILDIMLPEKDGLTILSDIRKNPNTKDIPVIILSALGSEFDKIYGLDNGADDYIVKPFSMMELLARIRALLRRTTSKISKANILEVPGIQMYIDEHVVKIDGNVITFTRKEYSLLKMLMENHGQVLTREQLLIKIWGYDFEGESRTVDVHMRTLRQKIEPYSAYIETIRGVGYRFGGNK